MVYRVPWETFELNFVLHDGNGTFENNAEHNFTYPVDGGISREDWIDIAAERRAQLAAREASEKAHRAAEAEKERQALALQNDKLQAMQAVKGGGGCTVCACACVQACAQ